MRCLALSLALMACGQTPVFDSKFLFGAAIAGFQVDPGCPTLPEAQCVDTRSDWYQFVTSRSQLPMLQQWVTFESLNRGPGHWELFESDFELAKKDMGLNSIRLSLEWSRLFPNATDSLTGPAYAQAANGEAVTRYHAMFRALKERGITPLVTLNHYTLPVWLHDGVACHQNLETCRDKGWVDGQRTIREIEKYAAFVAKEFGAEVDIWATENEPFAVVLPGYLQPGENRVNPPGLTLRTTAAKAVMTALIDAHARMYDAVKLNDTADADGDGIAASVGLVYAVSPIKPKDPAATVDIRAAANLFSLYNTAFLDAVCLGQRDDNLDGKPDGMPDAQLVNRMDWLGVNYYGHTVVKGTPEATFPDLSPISNFDPFDLQVFVDEPSELTSILKILAQRYQRPIYLTETGADASKDQRAGARWLVRYLDAVRLAKKEGVDVRGFYAWTLMDNYEWNHGMSLKFGLYAVDPNDASKRRVARPAVDAYRRAITAKDVPASLLMEYR
jgi:beta-galactosidase